MKKYIRLLSYNNACKLIDFIISNDINDFANIVTGGVCIEVADKNWEKVHDFIISLGVRYEIGTEEPYKVNQQIIEKLKWQNEN
jgi:hypothetical protein